MVILINSIEKSKECFLSETNRLTVLEDCYYADDSWTIYLNANISWFLLKVESDFISRSTKKNSNKKQTKKYARALDTVGTL